MITKDKFEVVEKNGRFIVNKNGQSFTPSRTDGQAIITEFDSKSDAEKYMSILEKLSKQKKYQKT